MAGREGASPLARGHRTSGRRERGEIFGAEAAEVHSSLDVR